MTVTTLLILTINRLFVFYYQLLQPNYNIDNTYFRLNFDLWYFKE